MTLAFTRTLSRASGRTIRSTYRMRLRASSDSGVCSLGSGRTVLAASCHAVAMTESSPRLLVMTSPVTARWSPMSTVALNVARLSSPTPSSEIMACSGVPSPERSAANTSLPVPRMKMTRPATVTMSPVCVSGPSASASYAARISGMEWVRPTTTG